MIIDKQEKIFNTAIGDGSHKLECSKSKGFII